MTRKSALYALAVVVLMGTMAVAALADDQWMNVYEPADSSVSANRSRRWSSPDAGEIREPMETGAVPERSESSSELNSYSSGDLPDLPTVEYGGAAVPSGRRLRSVTRRRADRTADHRRRRDANRTRRRFFCRYNGKWERPGAGPRGGGWVNRRSVAAFLGVILWSCVGGVSAVAGTPPVLSPAAARESSFLSAILRHSARGSRDLLGLPVDPSLPEREMTRLADRLRPEVVGAADGDHVVSAFRRVLLVEERFTYDKSSVDPGNYLLESVLARRKGTASDCRCSTSPSRIGSASLSAGCTSRPTVSSGTRGTASA